jgi:hypothetical protein
VPVVIPTTAQTNVDARAAPHMRMTTDIPPSITIPDSVENLASGRYRADVAFDDPNDRYLRFPARKRTGRKPPKAVITRGGLVSLRRALVEPVRAHLGDQLGAPEMGGPPAATRWRAPRENKQFVGPRVMHDPGMVAEIGRA